jgi:hypothetical protein
MTVDETDENIRGRVGVASLIEKSLTMQNNGYSTWANRPRHEIEHQKDIPLAPIVQINFSRPDKPDGWKVTDEYPEHGELGDLEPSQPTVLDATQKKNAEERVAWQNAIPRLLERLSASSGARAR